jgi:aspartate aminotransferase-like enzyme
MTLLLNPGPVTLIERVRRSLVSPDLCHREPELFDLQDEALSKSPFRISTMGNLAPADIARRVDSFASARA